MSEVYPKTDEFLVQVRQELGQESQGYPWMPEPGESNEAYMAFEMWRNLGHSRPRQTHKLALDHHWERRALAYDAWLQASDSLVQDQAQHIANQLSNSCNMLVQALSLETIKTMRVISQSPTPSVSLEGLVAAVEKVAKVSRLLADKSTENVSVRGNFDMSRYSDEELEQMEELRRKGELPG